MDQAQIKDISAVQGDFDDFFRTLLRPDRVDPRMRERATLARAANILQVGEFQFLQLAYHDWFLRELPAAMTGDLFRRYMFLNEVPAWARAFSRKILDQDARGILNANDPAWHRYDHDYTGFAGRFVRRDVLSRCRTGLWIGGLLALAVAISWLAMNSYRPQTMEGAHTTPPHVPAAGSLYDRT